MIPIQHFLVLSSILFSLGIYGVLARRSAVLILMSVELMLQAVAINFITFSVYLNQLTGQVFAIFVITVAAAEVGLALAIILRIFRNKATANVDEVDALKW